MRPGMLIIDNFMTIRHLEVNLSNKGLVLINGENLDDDAFDSNGSGKSATFSEAPTWCLTGKTIRDLPADKVINRNIGKNTRVSLELIDDEGGSRYEVIRHRSHSQHGNHVLLLHNGVNITGKSDKDTNILIEEVIGMDYLTFTNSIMFGQGITKMFAQSTDAEQKSILEQMLQIGVFKQCQDKTKEKIDVVKGEINTFNTDLQVSRNLKMGLDQQVEDLQVKEEELGEKIAQRIEELNKQKAAYVAELHGLENLSVLSKDLVLLKGVLDSSYVKMKAYEQQEKDKYELIRLIKSSEKELSHYSNFILTTTKNLQDIRDGNNVPKNCDKCGQALDLEDTTHIENHLENDISDAKIKVLAYEKEIVALQQLLDKVNKNLESKVKLEESIDELLSGISDLKLSIQRVTITKKSLDDSIVLTSGLIDEQEKLLTTTYTSLIEENIAKIKATSEIILGIENSISIKDKELAKYEFWLNGFGNKGIKSVLLDSVTPFLNKKANYYLSKLTGSSIEVLFTTQKETKSGKNKGEKQDKFSVTVTNKNGDDSYDGNSGGEKRRTDIAINMSLQDLVLSRSQKRFDLIVYDEVFDGLDGVGCENVIHLLHEKARECGSVLVVTHNDNLKQLFSHSVTVRKHNGETSLIQ